MTMAEGAFEGSDTSGENVDENLEDQLDPDMIEERFRVDRRKLELMLQASETGDVETGEQFFHRIMKESCTTITWPSRLKIGAKSKKDPHIKVAGLPEDIKLAKQKIMSVLDTKSNRVTLKMDVSYTDHSHIIGKGGNNIKKVMQETGCHIHFPDSNRGSQGEKSNQVSIAGQPIGVECARQQIRAALPIVMMIDLPVSGRIPMDTSSPHIQLIEQSCNVKFTFKQRLRTGNQTVIVRGAQQNILGMKEAIVRLVEHFTGNIASMVPVSMQLEIAPQHHLFVIGRNGSNIKPIMQQTGASIHFPDPNTSQRKSTIFISGSFESVVYARAQLMELLPLVLMFDLKEEECEFANDTVMLNDVMEMFDIYLSIKPKPKQLNKSVIIKSMENNAFNMYLARLKLLGEEATEKNFPGLIPTSIITNAYNQLPNGFPIQNMLLNGNNSSMILLNGINNSLSSVTPTRQSTSHNPWAPIPSPESPTPQEIGGWMSSPHPFGTSNPPPPPPGLGPVNRFDPSLGLDSLNNNNDLGCKFSSSNGIESGASTGNSSGSERGKTPSPIGQRSSSPASHSSSSSPTPNSPTHCASVELPSDGGMQSFLDVALKQGYADNLTDCYGGSPVLSPGSSTQDLTTAQKSGLQSPSKRQTVAILSGAKNIDLHTSLGSTDTNGSDSLTSSLTSSLYDKLILGAAKGYGEYERKRVMAAQAMRKKVVFSEVRTPTSTWSGLGFSKSMPESAIKELMDFRSKGKGLKPPYNGPVATSYETTSYSAISNPSPSREVRSQSINEETQLDLHAHQNGYDEYSHYMGRTPSLENIGAVAASCSDLGELFDRLGLSKYTQTFHEQEVDLPTFLTLTESDLRELGVTALGARKKMLLAIQDMIRQQPLSKPGRSYSIPPVAPPQHKEFGQHLQRHKLEIASHSGRW